MSRLRPGLLQLQYLAWWLRGGRGPIPHAVKQRIVREYGRSYSLNVLVETGTYLGDMVWAVKDDFDEIHSIELDATLYQRATKRFAGFQNVHLHQGDSAEVLGQIVNELRQPALYWLDGHFSQGLTARGTTDTPIRDEIKDVFGQGGFGGVALIDDARLFTGEGDYPSLDDFKNAISDLNPGLRVSVADDVIRVVPDSR